VSVRRASGVIAIALLTGCVDRALTAPGSPAPAPDDRSVTRCTVAVSSRTVTCSGPQADASGLSTAASADRILGGQDVYVRLSSSGTAYDAGTEILSTNVTVENLTRSMMGTTDGATMTALRVFFQEQPTVTSGTGLVTVANADGAATFTGSAQPYFEYQQMLHSYEISSSRVWQFNVPATVLTFRFAVYLSAPVQDETASLLDRVWTGLTDGDWATASNWAGVAVPVPGSTVAVPPAALLSGTHSQPSLAAPTTVTNLRVGSGSSLALNALTLTASGNVDVVGTITGGQLALTGAYAMFGGTVDGLRITGGAVLQRAVTATGSVSVEDGSITAVDRTLSIAIP
jgi:hypothetical protein